MLTLLLVAGGLAAMFCGSLLVGLALGRLVRRGEEQDRQTRQAARRAASWGRDIPAAPPSPDTPAHGQPRHRRHR
ncbi:hypothetical protein ACTVZO_05315 [Streptomyces sp. IBSNAI002]|uniref:hypothetical protein n=1 Tax=Streptomyces sp. IBSNAI002 TaxID=3457500 RepID=UPI003FD33374